MNRTVAFRLLLLLSALIVSAVVSVASAQQPVLLADLSIAPAGAWTLEQLEPLSSTDTALSGVRLPPPSTPLAARAVHSISKQPLLGVEIELVAAMSLPSASSLLFENWTSIDSAAPPLPLLINNRNFTDGNGYAYFPNLVAVRGCLPAGTQLMARAVFNASARSPIHSAADVAKQVQLAVIPSRSACIGRVPAFGEAPPAAALPNDGRVLLRILRALAAVTDIATLASVRSVVIPFVLAQQAAAMAAATTTTAASSSAAPTVSVSTSANPSTTTTIGGAAPTTGVSDTSTTTSVTTTSTTTTTSATTTTTTTTATATAGGSTTLPPQTASYPATTYDATPGYALPVRAFVLDTCGQVTGGHVMADRQEGSTATSGADPASSSTTVAATTAAPSSSGGGGDSATTTTTTARELSASAQTSLLRTGWLTGSLIYTTAAASAAASGGGASVATFDWIVLSNEIGAVRATFFLPHRVDRISISTAALSFAQFVVPPPANVSVMRHVCDAQSIGIKTRPVPPAGYGAPALLQNESKPVFEVQQADKLESVLPGVSIETDYLQVEAYSRAASRPASVPSDTANWLVPKGAGSASTTASGSTTGTAAARTAEKVFTIDNLRTGLTRFSVSLPLAATSTSTLRGAFSLASLDVASTAPRGVALLSRYLREVSDTTTPVTLETKFSVALETALLTLDDIDDKVTVKFQFTRQNPVPRIDPFPSNSSTTGGGGAGGQLQLQTLHVSFLFRQDVIFYGSTSIHSLFADRAMLKLGGSPLIALSSSSSSGVAVPTTTTIVFGAGVTTSAASLAGGAAQKKTEYAFRALSVVLPTANDSAPVLPMENALYGVRAAMDYLSFLSLFGRKFDAGVIGVTRFVTRTCVSDTYLQYDVSLHPLQFRIAPMPQGPGLNYAISTLMGNLFCICIIVSGEAVVYWAAGREVSSFPLHTMRVSKFLYAGTALAMVHSLHHTPNVAAAFAGGLSSFAFMLGVPIALAALALRAQLNFKVIFMFQPTKADQKRAMLLQRQHAGTDDTLALMKNRMLISLGYSDAVHLNKEDVIRDENAAAESAHMGWVGFVLSRLFLPPGHYLLSHRDHLRARPVYERYRSSTAARLLWLFSVGEMTFQLFLSMSYALSNCTVRYGLVVTLHAVKLALLCVMLPLLTVMDNLIAITTSSLLIAAIVLEIREERSRADVAYAACSIFYGISNLLDAICAVMSSKHFVAWVIKMKAAAAEDYNKSGTPEYFARLRRWCVFGLCLMILRQREAGIEMPVDRRQIRALLLRGGEDTVQQVKSQQQKLEEKEARREMRRQRRREAGLDSQDGEDDEELLLVRQQDIDEAGSPTFLFHDDDLLTEEDRAKLVRGNILEMDARSASEHSRATANNKSSDRSASAGANSNGIKTARNSNNATPVLDLDSPDVDLDAFFDAVAQEFASSGEKHVRWGGKRPGGVAPVYDRYGIGGGGLRSPSQDSAAGGGRVVESERDRERRLRVLDDPHLLDRFLKGDETALDFSAAAELTRPWIDPSLFIPEAIDTSQSYKMNKAMAGAEFKKRKLVESRKGAAAASSSPLHGTKFAGQDEEIDFSSDPLLADVFGKKPQQQQQQAAGGAAPAAETGEDGMVKLTPEQQREIFFTINPQFRHLRPAAPTTVAAAAAIAAEAAASGAGGFVAGGSHAATAAARTPAAVAAAALLATAAVPKTKKQLQEEREAEQERERQLYQLRHFYHNCGPKAQREVDDMLGPLEQTLHEQGMVSPVIAQIRAPIATPGASNNNSPSPGGGGGIRESLAHRGMDEEIALLDKNSQRLLQMEQDPTVYIPPFVWADDEQERRFQRASSLHPMLSSALSPAGGRFVSRIATLPDGSIAHNVSRLRVKKVAEVEDEVGNPVCGKVVVERPVPEHIGVPDSIMAGRNRSGSKRRRNGGKNVVKRLLLAHLFEEGTTGEGVLVESDVLHRRRREQKRRDRLAQGMSAEQIAIIETSSEESDNEKPTALRDGDSDDDIAVSAAQSKISTRSAIRSNPINANEASRAIAAAAAASSKSKSSGNRPRNQLQDVFREGDRRDRKLARKTFGTESMLAQARIYALDGDTLKLAELTQYDPSWFRSGKSIHDEAKEHQFLGAEAAAVAEAVAIHHPPAPAPLLKIRVGADDDYGDDAEAEEIRRRSDRVLSTAVTRPAAAIVSGRSYSSPQRTRSVHGSTFIPRVGSQKPSQPKSSQLR